MSVAYIELKEVISVSVNANKTKYNLVAHDEVKICASFPNLGFLTVHSMCSLTDHVTDASLDSHIPNTNPHPNLNP